MARQPNQPAKAQLNLTSMMDIVFLLILFFLLVTNFASAELPKLEVLSLEETTITDVGVNQLVKFQRLAWLDLSATGLSDGSLETLTELGHLQALILHDTDISEAGMGRLSATLTETRIFDDQNRAPFFNFSYGQ